MKNDRRPIKAKKTVNWEELHQRMDAARLALEENTSTTNETSRATLKQRARLLSNELTQTDTVQESIEVIVFTLASETYAIQSDSVLEAYPLKEFTPLPGVPSFIMGIVNIRGQIFSIINLKIFFSLPEKGLGQLNKLIILRNNTMEFGILADEIIGVTTIPLASIQASPPTLSGVGAKYLLGVSTNQIMIINAEKLLTDEQIIVYQETE
jgi:purine-binding chemotaxis protein CheW